MQDGKGCLLRLWQPDRVEQNNVPRDITGGGRKEDLRSDLESYEVENLLARFGNFYQDSLSRDAVLYGYRMRGTHTHTWLAMSHSGQT